MFGSFGEKKSPRIIGVEYRDPSALDDDLPTPICNGRDDDNDNNKYKRKRSTEKLSTWFALVVLTLCFSIFFLVVYMDQNLPTPLTLQDVTKHPEKFIEERARNALKKLTSVGSRPTGSYENEVLAVDFLRRQISSIQQKSKPIHKLTLDIQKPRGSFNLNFVDGLTHHYRNIQNLIVKLESGHGGKDALLVNCHFDSVPQSPGASDDAVSCAIMLELLEVLTQSDEPYRHNIIFLFNGAEENMLPGSHGFITQHVWAQEIRAFINLEACGSGGRELVFQTGPGHPWLLEAYANVAPHPFASVIGQEIFQSGVIPGDTDFRIFRDYGKIPGIDIAYMKNGYVYHTKYDTEDRIPAGSIQRAGDNVLAVVKHLAQSDVLAHTQEHSHGSLVFFDFLGLFMIHYPEWLGICLNFLVIITSVTITCKKAVKAYQYGVTSQVYIRQLGYTFFVQFCGGLASIVAVTLVAIILDLFGKTMTWYGKPYLIFFLYMSPTMMAVIAVFHFALPRQKQYFQFVDGVWVIESLYFEVSKLLWTFFTLVMTFLGLKSSFFCMIWVLFPMTGRFILDILYDRNALVKKRKDWKWLALHFISLIVPLILNMYLIYTTFTMFIPIMGRAGSAVNPDLLIGYKAASMTLATMSFLCPLVMVMNKPGHVTTSLYMTTVITMIIVITTKIGFPYSATSSGVAPHRSLIVHTAREFYNKGGDQVSTDSGYFLVNLDRNSPRVLLDYVPELYSAREVSDEACNKHLFCGMPVYYPCASMLRINHWIPTSSPRIYQDSSIELAHTEETQPHILRLLFTVKGPDHMSIFFSPVPNVKLTAWSFSDEILTGPNWKDDRPTYYVFYSHGLSPTSWQFWIELAVPRSYTKEHDDLLDLSIAGHILHGHGMKGPDFKKFLEQFPPWSYPVGWTATYKAYKF